MVRYSFPVGRFIPYHMPVYPGALPGIQPPAGLVIQNADDKRLGIWIMRDNQSKGDLETFLQYLVPKSQFPLWQHAEHAVKEAVALGAGCKDGHTPKAHLYTWLAWQDPPGRSPGIALTQKVLDANSGFAQPFVTWFKDLYQLPAKQTTKGCESRTAESSRLALPE